MIKPQIEAEDRPRYEMHITVSPDCIMKDVRAMLAVGNLNALGTIVSVTPDLEAIEDGVLDGKLRLLIASDAGEEALKTAASGTEIATVEILPAEQQIISTPAQIPDEIKPSDPDKKQAPSSDKTREIKNLRVDIHQLDHIMNLVEDLGAEAAWGNGSDSQVGDLARRFLAQRDERRTRSRNPLPIEFEQQREWLEGLARYAELAIWRQPNLIPGYTPLPAIQDDPDFNSYTGFE